MSSDLRKLARGKPCLIRLPSVCNGNRETTVLAHVRLPGISGMGLKAPDLLGSYACSACHVWVDTHHDDATKVAFYEGILRTINDLIRRGVITTVAWK